MIQGLNIPVYDEKILLEREKRWKIESSYLLRMPGLNIPDISLNFPEIISLCMLAGESVVFKGTEIDRHISRALTKFMHFLPEDTRSAISGLKQIFICKTIGSKTYAGKDDTLKVLTESILNRTVC